jgi:hypothetical protein
MSIIQLCEGIAAAIEFSLSIEGFAAFDGGILQSDETGIGTVQQVLEEYIWDAMLDALVKITDPPPAPNRIKVFE